MNNQLFTILRFKFIAASRASFSEQKENRYKIIALSIIFTLFLYGTYTLTYSIIDSFIVRFRIGSFLLHRFISVMLFMFFISVNAGNILVSYSSLFKSKEIEFYFSRPTIPVSLFMVKFFETFFQSSGTLFSVLSASLLAYIVYFHLTFWHFFSILLFILLPFTLIAALLGVIVLMILIKGAEKFGLKAVSFFLTAWYLISMWFSFAASSPEGLARRVIKSYPNYEIDLRYTDSFWLKFFPNHWVSESLFNITRGEIKLVYGYVVYIFLALIIVFSLTYLLAKKYYLLSFHLAGSLRFRKREEEKSRNYSGLKISANPYWVILKRDILLFIREPLQLYHLILMGIIITAFVVSFGEGTLILVRQAQPEIKTIFFLVLLFFNLFLIGAISLRFVFPMVSLEGLVFWKVKSSPLSIKRLLALKFVTSFFVLLLISAVINTVSFKIFPPRFLIISSVLSVFSSFALCAISFGSGVIYCNLKEKNPIKLSSSLKASSSFLVSIMYMAVITGILYLPVNQFFKAMFYNQTPSRNILIFPVAIIAIFSIILGLLFLYPILKFEQKEF